MHLLENYRKSPLLFFFFNKVFLWNSLLYKHMHSWKILGCTIKCSCSSKTSHLPSCCLSVIHLIIVCCCLDLALPHGDKSCTGVPHTLFQAHVPPHHPFSKGLNRASALSKSLRKFHTDKNVGFFCLFVVVRKPEILKGHWSLSQNCRLIFSG